MENSTSIKPYKHIEAEHIHKNKHIWNILGNTPKEVFEAPLWNIHTILADA